MNSNTLIDASLAKLDELLVRNFGARGTDFAGKAETAAAGLPEDLAELLMELRQRLGPLQSVTEPDPQRLVEFAFRCGEVHARLMAYFQVRMELENVVVGPVSIGAAPLQPSEVEPLARFVELRDRLFRKVADFTLKALLIGLGLLTLGLVLGLI